VGRISYQNNSSDQLSWTGYYHGKVIYLYANNKEFVSAEESIDENKIYKITYLPKTHLIVRINEGAY
jgi:hypothetical protein